MSLLPAYLLPRKPNDDPAVSLEPDNDAREDVFRLLPPRTDAFERLDQALSNHSNSNADPLSFSSQPEPALTELPKTPPAPAPESRNVHQMGVMDLERLSIDNDGRLYWDGKPVEVRRKLMMSRAQILGASLLGLLVFICAIGAVLQGSAAAYDWACRFGWADSHCSSSAPTPPARFDIPA